MKTQIQKNTLAFNKNVMVELNDSQMKGIDSGATPTPWILFGGAIMVGIAIGSAFDD